MFYGRSTQLRSCRVPPVIDDTLFLGSQASCQLCSTYYLVHILSLVIGHMRYRFWVPLGTLHLCGSEVHGNSTGISVSPISCQVLSAVISPMMWEQVSIVSPRVTLPPCRGFWGTLHIGDDIDYNTCPLRECQE